MAPGEKENDMANTPEQQGSSSESLPIEIIGEVQGLVASFRLEDLQNALAAYAQSSQQVNIVVNGPVAPGCVLPIQIVPAQQGAESFQLTDLQNALTAYMQNSKGAIFQRISIRSLLDDVSGGGWIWPK